MKQVLFLTLFGLATCSIYAPARSYPSNQTPQPFRQYGPPAVKYGVPPFQRQVPILRLETRNTGDGTYNYAYETANGISVDEHGDTRGDGTRAQGRYSYTAPNGEGIALQYTADENGFLPQGSHLPSGLSGAILKSVQQNLEEEKRGIVDDGQYREQMQRYGQGQRYTPAQQYGVPEKYNIAQKHRVTSSYTPAQQYGVPEKYNVPQKYGVPSSYRSPANYKLSVNYGLPATNTPQRFNTQTIALPRTPHTGYY